MKNYIKDILTFTDAAKLLKTSRQNVSLMIIKHNISTGMIGVQKYITREDLEILKSLRKGRGAPKGNKNAQKQK